MLNLGPLALPWGLLLLLVSWQFGTWLAHRHARSQHLELRWHAYALPLAIVMGARLGFVVEHSQAYAAAPVQIIDIRDGGWNSWVGLAVGVVYVAAMVWRKRPVNRALLSGFSLAALIWLTGQALLHLKHPVQTNLPSFSTLNLLGESVQLDSLKGQPVVVNLWASWCPPCRREMPVLMAGQQNHPNIQFIWINQGEPAHLVHRYALRQGLPPAQTWLDPSLALTQSLQQRSLPTTLFYDAAGNLTAIRNGELSTATLESHVEAILQPGN